MNKIEKLNGRWRNKEGLKDRHSLSLMDERIKRMKSIVFASLGEVEEIA